MMPTHEDRWRWVLAGLSLLRDEGLVLNPGDPDLCRELAWLFELKLGTDIDAAGKTYRKLWRKLVEDVRARGAWDELRMDPKKMLVIEKDTGFDDWTDPQLSAIYWAAEGLGKAQNVTRAMLLEIMRQAGIIYKRNRKLEHDAKAGQGNT